MKLQSLFCAVTLMCASTIFLGAQPRPGTLLWSFTPPFRVTSAAALAFDGTVYLGTDGALYALSNAGSNKWTFPGGVVGSPAIASDGTVYFSDGYSSFHAVKPDGSEKWVYNLGAAYASSPAIAADGSIYICASGKLFALTKDGTLKWKYVTDEISDSPVSPVIGPDGTVYVGAFFRGLYYAFESTGELKWSLNLQNNVSETAAIAPDGTIYLSAGDLCAISPDGALRWRTSGIVVGGSPAIGRDGTIYAAYKDETSLWSISPTGQTNWNAVPAPVFHPPGATVPAIDASGTIYYCNSNAVWALDVDGSVQWVYEVAYGSIPVPASTISPAIGTDAAVYAAFANTLYVIKANAALADSPWPMYRQNPRHTGKVERPVMKQPQKRADSGFQFQLYPNELGRAYQIDFSTNLNTWTSLTSFVATTLPTPVVDSDASNAPSRFYRAFAP